MSFILEALKKSESERNRGRVKTLALSHFEPGRRPIAPYVATAVVAAVVFAGFGWWISRQTTTVGFGSVATKSVAEPPPQVLRPMAPDRSRSVSMPSVNRTQAAIAPAITPPRVSLDALSYSDDPSRRFVMINQKIYHEGQWTEDGLRVQAVTRTGAVLAFQGQEFVVTP